jgi:hypothetical protein
MASNMIKLKQHPHQKHAINEALDAFSMYCINEPFLTKKAPYVIRQNIITMTSSLYKSPFIVMQYKVNQHHGGLSFQELW